MKKERILIAGAAALMAIACDNASSITGPELTNAQPRFAIGFHTSEQDIPWTMDEPNPCNNDIVSTTGSTHLVFGSSFDGNGGVHLSIKFSSRGSGVGAPSLLAYEIKDQDNNSDQDASGPQATILAEEQLMVTAAKPALNYIRHTVFKITFNAEGIPTAMVDNMFNKCGGQTIDATI